MPRCLRIALLIRILEFVSKQSPDGTVWIVTRVFRVIHFDVSNWLWRGR